MAEVRFGQAPAATGGIPGLASPGQDYNDLAAARQVDPGNNNWDSYDWEAYAQPKFTWAGGTAPPPGSTGGGGGAGSGNGGGGSSDLNALQAQYASGLADLLHSDTTAETRRIQDALFASSSEGINTAAERQRQQDVEGTFARGVGSSSIGVEMAGRLAQEHDDALARAARDAQTGAAAEERANRSTRLNELMGGFGAATTGIQGAANIDLAKSAQAQAASQFQQNLGFQGQQNTQAQAAQMALAQMQAQAQAAAQASGQAFTGAQNTQAQAAQRAIAELQLQAQQAMRDGDFAHAQVLQDQAAKAQAALQQASFGQQTSMQQAGFGQQTSLTQMQLDAQAKRQQDQMLFNALAAGGSGLGSILDWWSKQ